MNEIIDTSATTDKKLRWHQAFYASIQIEFADEADKLFFENEHHIGTQPKRIDLFPIQLLVTKDLTDEQNLWLHNLTNDINASAAVDTLISEYEKH